MIIMKYLLMCLVLLVAQGVAAGETLPKYEYAPWPDPLPWHCYQDGYCHEVAREQTPCEQQMEAAMISMDILIRLHPLMEANDIVLNKAIWKQWQTAKASCWKSGPVLKQIP